MRALIVALAVLGSGALLSNSVDDRFLLDFLVGRYSLIGKAPGSDETYCGDVEIRRAGNQLQVLRTIRNVHTQGIATLERVTADKISILRIRLTGAVDQEETCMIGSDLDNYPRITCYLYKVGGDASVSPGLEALFIKRR